MSDEPTSAGTTRREVLTKAVFVAPAVLTLSAVPSFASAGSSSHEHGGEQKETKDKKKKSKYGNFGD
jgi:hypothetical protein